MTKYLIAFASALLFSITVQAQSITIAEMIAQLDPSFESTEKYLKTKQFYRSTTTSVNNIKCVFYTKLTGDVQEAVMKSMRDSSIKLAPGITYDYNKWSYTSTFMKELGQLQFKLSRKYNDSEKTTWLYFNDKYEVRIYAYNDTSKHTNMQVTWVDERKLHNP